LSAIIFSSYHDFFSAIIFYLSLIRTVISLKPSTLWANVHWFIYLLHFYCPSLLYFLLSSYSFHGSAQDRRVPDWVFRIGVSTDTPDTPLDTAMTPPHSLPHMHFSPPLQPHSLPHPQFPLEPHPHSPPSTSPEPRVVTKKLCGKRKKDLEKWETEKGCLNRDRRGPRTKGETDLDSREREKEKGPKSLSEFSSQLLCLLSLPHLLVRNFPCQTLKISKVSLVVMGS
jgi:hypothetical protein